jgi:hypothetical protein
VNFLDVSTTKFIIPNSLFRDGDKMLKTECTHFVPESKISFIRKATKYDERNNSFGVLAKGYAYSYCTLCKKRRTVIIW